MIVVREQNKRRGRRNSLRSSIALVRLSPLPLLLFLYLASRPSCDYLSRAFGRPPLRTVEPTYRLISRACPSLYMFVTLGLVTLPMLHLDRFPIHHYQSLHLDHSTERVVFDSRKEEKLLLLMRSHIPTWHFWSFRPGHGQQKWNSSW